MTFLQERAHRPWPWPDSPYIMYMDWLDLLFAHWPVTVEALRPHIPKDLEIDTFEGQAWIGVVPFRMANTRPRFFPNIPGVSNFLELNVRTYVTKDGKPGVWFFSLDAESYLAVRGARFSFNLPYFDAAMSFKEDPDGTIHYASKRTHKNAPSANFEASYKAEGEVYKTQKGSLEYWLTERYCLYSQSKKGRLYRADIHHAPWPLQKASAEIRVNTMCEAGGVKLPDEKPLLHFVKGIETCGWLVKAVK
ncbi:MAG: DUF2071 domain-containing protein [Planctomycetota bacterium]|nr:DUF2071 domain-containing protein [Planctomycetota bacterium]